MIVKSVFSSHLCSHVQSSQYPVQNNFNGLKHKDRIIATAYFQLIYLSTLFASEKVVSDIPGIKLGPLY